ncbi:glucuronate isomerase [Candidatus Enterococcus clewellii]|uniref:Uronate isomerase n=1 Tax=Candidatus Enterococcus clewellii TaxID=1834193 RepID=A0A242K8Y5_9ENTE|nr:glucuronate isomerase [Enterococcus sp. 9E7_DIV0242]OTP17623.1 hypothetical protein A5888_001761 [Enterococcus sp. 9E7_DIV0242]
MFLDKNFLVPGKWGQKLFHTYAKQQPIVDYHCHLEAQTIYENKQYENLTQLWLNDQGVGDHYKWRLMRTNGVVEELVSGKGDDYQKYLAFVGTMEKAIGNPIYEWSHLELRRYFDIELTINQENAPMIWALANKKIRTNDYRPQELIRLMKVKAICTTDDPADSLEYHRKLASEVTDFKVLPTFRPDKIWSIDQVDYQEYLKKLEQLTGSRLHDFDSLKRLLTERIDYFAQAGCRLADHGLNHFVYEAATTEELDDILQKAQQGFCAFSQLEKNQFITAIQLHLMRVYLEQGWTMQMHLNAFRDDSRRLKAEIGANVGGDSMGDQPALTANVVKLLAVAEEGSGVPKLILYSLNPNDWLPLITAAQSFQGGGMQQRIQLGCAWWFNDTCEGMREQLTTVAQQSLLANFTGMLTDSRSFLSYPRHEYFRRVLCQLVGEWVEQGRLPEDEAYLGQIIEDICYNNAKNYFGFFDE